MKFEAEVRELAPLHVLCVRHVGPYPEIAGAIHKLFEIAGPLGLIDFPKSKLLGVFYDDPDMVDPAQLRSDACITVPDGIEAPEGTHTILIPGGKFAVAHVEIDPAEYGDAWKKLQREWIPSQGLSIDADSKRLCYEVYINNPEEHPESKNIAEICEPVL